MGDQVVGTSMQLNGRLNGRQKSGRPNRSRDRGQAEVVGLVLIIGMTVAGLTVIVGFGAQTIEDSQSQSQIQRAEHAMTQFDSRASLVGLGTTNSQTLRTNFQGTNSDFYVDENAGWMNVSIYNETTGDLEEAVMNVTLGAVVFEKGDTTVAYQGGGVWKKTGDGAVMVSPPEYHFRATSDEPTLTLPVVLVRGDRNLDSTVAIKRNAPVEAKYPVDGNENRTNPFDGGIVNITVHSEYYESWGQFMEDRADGAVTYDHDRGTVTTELISTDKQFKIERGVHLSNGDTTYNHFHSKQGKSGVWEYNSSVGPVGSSTTGYGDISSEGGIEIQDGRFNTSNVISGGGEVRLEKDGWTPGNLSYNGWVNNQSSMDFHVRGWVRTDTTVTRSADLDGLVEDKRDAFAASNDNTADSDIVLDGGEWTFASGNTWDLKEGNYYLNASKIDWKDGDEKLTIDLSDGDVEIVVMGDWTLDNGAQIEVINPDSGTAKIYLAADTNPHFELNGGSAVNVTGDKATALWMFGKEGKQTRFKVQDGSTFTGVFYAPGHESVKTRAEIMDNARVNGALVLTEIKLEDNGRVYFDVALSGSDPVGAAQYTGQITFLHVSVNEVRVES